MASTTDVVEIFECEGKFSFLHELHHFTFTIHQDKSLQVVIQPGATTTRSAAVSTDFQDCDFRQNEILPRRAATPNNEVQPHVQDEELEVKLFAYDGRALVEIPHVAKHGRTSAVGYVVHFKIVQWGRPGQGMGSEIVKCIAHLSLERGMSGRFVDIQDSSEEAQEFSLRLSRHRVESMENPLHPLTPGRYKLQGITIAENAFVYECAVDLTLQANGMMSGTSSELPFAQECPLAGMWTRSGLNYLLQYEMRSNKNTYSYFGTPLHSRLQGTWQNAELPVLGRNLNTHTSQAERGILEFQLVKAVRVWSEEFHKDYPMVFKECVKLMLLASHRDDILPNHLWRSIVSYCGYDWFQSDFLHRRF